MDKKSTSVLEEVEGKMKVSAALLSKWADEAMIQAIGKKYDIHITEQGSWDGSKYSMYEAVAKGNITVSAPFNNSEEIQKALDIIDEITKQKASQLTAKDIIPFKPSTRYAPGYVDPSSFITIKPRTHLKYIRRILDILNGKSAWICGGYARYKGSVCKVSKLAKPTDLDIFFLDLATLEEVKAELIKKGWLEIADSEWATTLQRAYFLYPIQLIKPVGEPKNVEDILNGFDFTACMYAILDFSTILVYEKGHLDEAQKKLKLHKVGPTPLIAYKRLNKYVAKGYTASTNTILTILEMWHNWPEEERKKILAENKVGEKVVGWSYDPTGKQFYELKKLKVTNPKKIYQLKGII